MNKSYTKKMLPKSSNSNSFNYVDIQDKIINAINAIKSEYGVIIDEVKLNKLISSKYSKSFERCGCTESPKGTHCWFDVKQNSEIITISFGNFKTGLHKTHVIKIHENTTLYKKTPQQIRQDKAKLAKQQAEALVRETQEKEAKAKYNRDKFMTLTPFSYKDINEYWDRKQLYNLFKYNLRYDNYNNLCIPMYNADYEMQGYQRISGDGNTKRFSGSSGGNFWQYPLPNNFSPALAKSKLFYILGEGLATVLSAYQVLTEDMTYHRHNHIGFIALVGFNASNISKCIDATKKHGYPFIYLVDNDDSKSTNTGVNVARKIVETYTDINIMPIILRGKSNEAMDCNDFLVKYGHNLLSEVLYDKLTKYKVVH